MRKIMMNETIFMEYLLFADKICPIVLNLKFQMHRIQIFVRKRWKNLANDTNLSLWTGSKEAVHELPLRRFFKTGQAVY